MNWLLILITFLGVNLDFFFILLLLLKKHKLGSVMMGYLIGLWVLLILSFSVGQILDRFLPEWVLGLLGILPIYMALKDEDEDAKEVNHKSSVVITLITYLSVCSGCNLALFLPVLSTISAIQIMEVIAVLTVLSILVILIIKWIGNIKPINDLMKKYGEILTKVVYIGVGIYVLFDSGLIAHVISWF
ncbi:cadmium resistance transporter [Apilactobacillus kunkeei]|uniref:cadmium resistance transporter n=1 Tax=Apilactobacillus kunkeei TaxID=148814 RepID=UPI0006C4557C|nr:cadmium resistance transporter [Apilactobacillus kunkeei]KOY72107.1 Cadmium resistance protein family permease [Apilactobacillus kunkeei]